MSGDFIKRCRLFNPKLFLKGVNSSEGFFPARILLIEWSPIDLTKKYKILVSEQSSYVPVEKDGAHGPIFNVDISMYYIECYGAKFYLCMVAVSFRFLIMRTIYVVN